MISRVKSVTFLGLEPREIEIQTHFSNGLPGLVIVGLVSKAVAESKERVRAAINSLGLSLPAKRIVINLAPADLAKEGSHFDLAIALSILIGMGIIQQSDIDNTVILGELSLDGRINSVRGVLPSAVWSVDNDMRLVCPKCNVRECSILRDSVDVLAPETLISLIDHLRGRSTCESVEYNDEDLPRFEADSIECDMKNIKGQHVAKRAVIIAACGGHNILLNGHPGTGKSMLASAFAGILPPLTAKEIIEVTCIYSVAGLIKDGSIVLSRPYRSPHHSASAVSIVGGGRGAKFGEITLAHRGVLFLDEFPEFDRQVLDSLRQPLENGVVSIARADYRISYPSKFQLFAAMNPCKCGYFGDAGRQCRKVPICAAEYESKVSGPILDRIDVIANVETESVDFGLKGRNEDVSEGSAYIRDMVCAVRDLQRNRYDEEGLSCNAELTGALVDKYCIIDDETKQVIQDYSKKFSLSMRGYAKTLKIARTIADMSDLSGSSSSSIKKEHVMEALSYRSRGYNCDKFNKMGFPNEYVCV